MCSNTDKDENEGKKVQNEGVSLLLVDRTENNGPLSRLKNVVNNSAIVN